MNRSIVLVISLITVSGPFLNGCNLVNSGSSDKSEQISASSKSAEYYYRKGNEFYESGDFINAIAEYTLALRKQPDYARAYLSRGLAKRKLDDYQGAIADYTSAIDNQPDYAQAYFNRGMAHRKLGHFSKAIADYNAAIKYAPDLAQA